MKKILSLFIALLFSYTAFAQVAFLQRVDNAETGYPAEEFNSVAQQPEKNAYDWFKTNYEDLGKGSIISMTDVLTISPNDYKVLWVNVDAVGLANLAAANIDEAVIKAIKAYVQAGGNLLLTKQASTLAYSIGRINYAPQWANGGYSTGGDTWSINPHIGYTVNHTDRSGHSIYSEVETIDTYTYNTYPLVGADPRTDNNCNFEPMKRKDGTLQNNEENNKLVNFETDWNCQVLATWGQVTNFCVPGLIEFFPDGDFKGTVIVNGLSAYQWGTNNTKLNNVQKLTANILAYLSKRASATWTTAPKANPVIKDEENVAVTADENCTVTVTTSDPNIANYNVGHIYYNFFGDVTFTATATGDGINIPKNAVLFPETRTVTGGAPAAFGYILPFSIHTISANGYNEDGNYLPDFLAALWFYNEYVSQGTGCFINPADATIPSEVKVLWINSDKNGLTTSNFDAAYASTEFVTTLTNFYNAGGNFLLTKQAVRMLRKLGRYNNGEYPTYAEGTNTNNNDDWNIRNSFFAGDNAVDYSSHAIFKDLESPFTLIAGDHVHRTNNNNLIYDEVFNDKAAMQSFETETNHNCRILGTWPNAENNKCDRGVIAEFLPKTATAGTIIEVGASAYQWNDKGTIDLENVHPNMKKLTSNILSYLYYSLNVYTRDVTPGLYGTICLPRASASVENATIWSVLKVADDDSGIMLQEVGGNEMVAGKPYFFYATATPIRVTMTGAAVLNPVEGNGLIGNFGPAAITVAKDANNYILREAGLYYVNSDNVTIGANRAYLNRSEIIDVAPAPGRIVRKMSIHTAPNTATGLESPQEDTLHPIKKIVNGHLYIQYGDKVYDITGNQIQ